MIYTNLSFQRIDDFRKLPMRLFFIYQLEIICWELGFIDIQFVYNLDIICAVFLL